MLKIAMNKEKAKIIFSDLEQKEIFILNKKGLPFSPIFMKTDTIVDDDNITLCNAVNLNNGETCVIEEEVEVIPVNGTLEINRA